MNTRLWLTVVPHQGRNDGVGLDIGGRIPVASVGYKHQLLLILICPLCLQEYGNALAVHPREVTAEGDMPHHKSTHKGNSIMLSALTAANHRRVDYLLYDEFAALWHGTCAVLFFLKYSDKLVQARREVEGQHNSANRLSWLFPGYLASISCT